MLPVHASHTRASALIHRPITVLTCTNRGYGEAVHEPIQIVTVVDLRVQIMRAARPEVAPAENLSYWQCPAVLRQQNGQSMRCGLMYAPTRPA